MARSLRRTAHWLTHWPVNLPILALARFLEFRITANPAKPDLSQIPAQMIPNPDLSNIPVVRERTFEFGSGAKNLTDPTDKDPWGVKTDGGTMLQRRLRPGLRGAHTGHT